MIAALDFAAQKLIVRTSAAKLNSAFIAFGPIHISKVSRAALPRERG
jgi:hypothetical protein